jgi:hypothetical protein
MEVWYLVGRKPVPEPMHESVRPVEAVPSELRA